MTATTSPRADLLAVHSVDEFVFSVPDLQQARHFYTSFGLDVRDEAKGLAASEEELLVLALFGEEAEPLLRAIRDRSSGEESQHCGQKEQGRAHSERARRTGVVEQDTTYR